MNGHVFFWAKMWGSGDSHGQRDRIIDSKVVSSEQLASLYLMYKDHKKEKGTTRPVVTGCTSNTKGFSNSVSDLLESVNKAKEQGYEVISGEDMLARVENYNQEAEKIKAEGREKLCSKMKCKEKCHKVEGMRIIAACEKLWQAKVRGSENENDEGYEAGCKDDLDDDIVMQRMRYYGDDAEMLDGADMQIVMECDECGPGMTEYLLSECEECGTAWVREDYTLTVIGNDVIALFPSLDSANTGRIIREEVEKSTIEIEGFNVRLGVRYIAMNREYTGGLDDLEHLLPRRLTKPGVKPSMKCKWVNHKEILNDDDWVYPRRKPTKQEERMIVGRVAEIGTRVLFQNFVYTFGGDAYQQQSGGPIGARITMCAAKMVMQHWADRYYGILIRAGLRVPLFTGYVDDGRQGGTCLRKGMRFCSEVGAFVFDKDQYEMDIRENEPDNVRMRKRCLPAMNHVNVNLKFTTEAPEDFPQQRLPTLDFVIWLVDGILRHSYFEKAMKTQFTVMQRSAMGEHQRMAILSNELVRRLNTIHIEVREAEMEKVVEQYVAQLKTSGYGRKQVREIVISGVIGWRRKMERREKAGQNQYLEARETLEERTDAKLLEKVSWFKGNPKRKLANKESKYQYQPPAKRMRKEGGSSKAIKAVMFVPYTAHSELANRLRESEASMEKMTGQRLKIVEKVGVKLVDILHKSDPWAGQDCGREGCLLCDTKKKEGKSNSQDCHRRNVIYQTWCRTCMMKQDQVIEERYKEEGAKKIAEMKRKEGRFIYIGETNRSVYERGLEHTRDVAGCKTSSHMLRHLIGEHEDEEDKWESIEFGMKILKTARSAYNRQVCESVLIQQERSKHHLMNSKSEYNRCALPRLTSKMGEVDLEKWREADKEEMRQEASIEEKVRIRNGTYSNGIRKIRNYV